jgi:hypothetical protein
VTSRPRTDAAPATTTVDTAGRHVIDVLDTVGDADVPRVVEREVASIEAQRRAEAEERARRAEAEGPDARGPDAPLTDGAALSAHDHGRLAELRVLAAAPLAESGIEVAGHRRAGELARHR